MLVRLPSRRVPLSTTNIPITGGPAAKRRQERENYFGAVKMDVRQKTPDFGRHRATLRNDLAYGGQNLVSEGIKA